MKNEEKYISILSQRKRNKKETITSVHFMCIDRDRPQLHFHIENENEKKKNAFEVRSWIGYGMWRKIKTMKWKLVFCTFFFFSGFDFDANTSERATRIQPNQWPLKLAHRSIYCVSGSCAPTTKIHCHTKSNIETSVPNRFRAKWKKEKRSMQYQVLQANDGKWDFLGPNNETKWCPFWVGQRTRHQHIHTTAKLFRRRFLFFVTQRIYISNCTWTYRRLFDPGTNFYLFVCFVFLLLRCAWFVCLYRASSWATFHYWVVFSSLLCNRFIFFSLQKRIADVFFVRIFRFTNANDFRTDTTILSFFFLWHFSPSKRKKRITNDSEWNREKMSIQCD